MTERKLKVSCMNCGKETGFDGLNAHECPVKLTEREQELLNAIVHIEFCDHYCCGFVDVVCKAKTLAAWLDAEHKGEASR